MQTSDLYALATLFALFVGPILAVKVTRIGDERAGKYEKKLNVFRSLMQTRGIRLDPVHVAALNTVEIEFYTISSVRSSFKAYVDHLGAPMPEEKQQEHFFEQRTDLFTTLLFEMGKSLNYQFDKRDLVRLSYVPIGWNTDQTLQRSNSQLLNQLLSGGRPLPVTTFLSSHSPYPEPPSDP